jgi:hypothetical protein
MALNETDRGWIKNAISEALKDHAKGWRETLRTFSLPSVAAAILIFTFTQWDKYAEFRTHANDKLDNITGRVTEIEKIPDQVKAIRRDLDHLLDLSAKETLQAGPVASLGKGAANQIKDAAEWAVQRKLDINPTAIQKVSESLLKNPDKEKWDATIALLNLRSVVNTTLDYAKQHVKATVQGGENVLFPSVGPGEWIEFVHAQFKLDGQPGERGLMRDSSGNPMRIIPNFIFKDSVVEYRGGKVTLVNVFFENCKFIITNNDNGRRLAEAILAPFPDTSFAGN